MIANFLVVLAVVLLAFGNASEVSERLAGNKFYEWLVAASQGVEDSETVTFDEAVTTNSLRSVRDESRFLQGYAMIAKFEDLGCSDSKFGSLDIQQVNTCIPVPGGKSVKYRLWITQRNNFGWTVNTWTDPHCSQGWAKEDHYTIQNNCLNAMTVQNIHKLPDIPTAWGTLFALVSYPNNDVCNAPTPSGKGPQGFNEIELYRLNHCYRQGDSKPDVMVTGCNDSTGISFSGFASTDGSCTGGHLDKTWDAGNACTNKDFAGNDMSPVSQRFNCLDK